MKIGSRVCIDKNMESQATGILVGFALVNEGNDMIQLAVVLLDSDYRGYVRSANDKSFAYITNIVVHPSNIELITRKYDE